MSNQKLHTFGRINCDSCPAFGLRSGQYVMTPIGKPVCVNCVFKEIHGAYEAIDWAQALVERLRWEIAFTGAVQTEDGEWIPMLEELRQPKGIDQGPSP